MSVENIQARREDHAFGQGLQKLIDARGWTPAEFRRQVYGFNEAGKARGNNVLPVLRGKERPRPQTLELYSEKLGVSVEQLIAMRTVAAEPTPPRTTRQAAAPGEQFSLVIDQAGRATLRLNMVDVPMEVAFRAMQALTGAGLLTTGETNG